MVEKSIFPNRLRIRFRGAKIDFWTSRGSETPQRAPYTRTTGPRIGQNPPRNRQNYGQNRSNGCFTSQIWELWPQPRAFQLRGGVEQSFFFHFRYLVLGPSSSKNHLVLGPSGPPKSENHLVLMLPKLRSNFHLVQDQVDQKVAYF